MSRGAILALLGVGAIAASAVVYFTWLEPDDSPLFSVDAPEPPSAEPGPGPAARPGPPQDRDEPRRPRRRRDAGGPMGVIPGGGAAQQFTGFIPPGGGGGPTRPQQPAPQQPDQGQEPDQQPTDDQYNDSLSRVLSRLDGG